MAFRVSVREEPEGWRAVADITTPRSLSLITLFAVNIRDSHAVTRYISTSELEVLGRDKDRTQSRSIPLIREEWDRYCSRR